ncbi:AAA family ATPase [Spirosoma sp. KCTC 42546]|uniref:AAA family ATPase n=1 Tax=Spirosoma sp. KCTC 42546 TaxID=2520506 RepID=UPI001158CB39|nr:AAA family ATPase [Spirosoma sp. KCTC 42546]QDK81269.1 AAA family ATPase [Spirosoma sp. KCTC 42546]
MRIRELSITNYRPFGKTKKLEFKENFSVIAGINGRGKTAILDAIALLSSRLLPQIAPAGSGFRKIDISDIHSDALETDLSFKLNCAGIPLDYSLHFYRESKRIDTTKLTPAVRKEIRNKYGDPSRADDQAPLAVYYTTDRAGYRFPKALPKAVRIGQSMAYNGALFNRTVDYKDFLARFRVVNTRRQEQNSSMERRAFNAISQTIELFLDGFTKLRVEDDPPRLLINKDGETRDIRQLSDGQRSFIALICDLGRRLALANPELENPLNGAGVVLIDELELHLHPKWQLEVSEKLRNTFPNIQFIVTTHSPFIIQTARQGEVITLDGELEIDPYGKSLEEVAKYVMDVENTEYSPRIKNMRETARLYLQLAEEAKTASPDRKQQIQRQIIRLLEPFSDNPAYTALLERKGIIEPEQ